MHFENKYRLYSLNISYVSDFEKCGYLSARKILFQNSLRESTCSRVLKTAETTMGELLSELSLDPRHIELQKVSVREM